jgi:hypothetical protein
MRKVGPRLSRGVSLLSHVLGVAVLGLVAVPVVLAQSATAPARASDAPVSLPSARSIIDRHIAAVGGRAAVLKHSSTRVTGTVTVSGNGMGGTFEILSAKPDRSLTRISLSGIGDLVEGYDGTTAWSANPMTGPMITQGKELEQKKFDADFYGDLRDAGKFPSMTTLEKTQFDGRACYKVSLVKKDGGEDIEFYDVATGLKAGIIANRESQMGPITSTMSQTDYKKFGDLLQPTTMKQSNMGVELILRITAIEYDKVDASVFDPPAAIKALIK